MSRDQEPGPAAQTLLGLQEVQARRRQLFSIMLAVFVLVAAGVVVFSLATGRAEDEPLGVLDFDILQISFVALSLVFALYVWLKERELRSAEMALVEAQIRTGALSNRLRVLSALAEAGKAMSSVLSLEDVLEVVLESARELLRASEGSLMLLDESQRHLRVAATSGLDNEILDDTVVAVGDGVVGRVAQSGEPVLLQRAADGFPSVVDESRKVRSAISAPLVGGGRTIGVINVSISRGDREFGQEDVEALMTFAGHAGIAIGNARAYEGERDARERLAEVDTRRRDFIATLTHDLKTPLTAILGYARLLTGGGDRFTKDEALSFVEVIDRQSQRILDMVERLMVATRLEEGQHVLTREHLDLPKIIEEHVEGMRGMLGERRVEVRVPEELPVLYGDRSAVEHALANLLDNAVKYSPDGTTVEVQVAVGEGEVSVAVVDEGHGIPEDLLPHVFERYRRATEEGGAASVGLGLFIVRSLAQVQGGRAWAENEPGRGARVTFTLPFRRDDR